MAKKRPAGNPVRKFVDPQNIPPQITEPGDSVATSAVELVRKLMDGGGMARASGAELADAMVNAFGGVQGIAARARIEYEYAPRGSPTRARILQLLMSMLQFQKGGEAVVSIDGMTDDEIVNEIVAIMEGATKKDPGSPKTSAGRALLEKAILGKVSAEQAALDAEIAELEENHEIDKLAAEEMTRAQNRQMAEDGIPGAIIPESDDETETYDFKYVDEEDYEVE